MRAAERIEYVKTTKLFRIGDLAVLILVLALIALTVWVALLPDGDTVEIYRDGTLVYSGKLSQDTTVDVKGDGSFVVRVENGEAWVSESDCEGQDCVHSSHIKSEGGTIVCLPNKIVVRVVSDSDDVEVLT